MRNLKLTIAYDGTNYQGWQAQSTGSTIQGVLEGKISRITSESVRLHAAGRTDAGVHALQQVANFTTSHNIPTPSLAKALNSMLPDDIVINDIEEVEPDFQARYRAKSKKYIYRFLQQPRPSPFERQYAWHIRKPLDIDKMRQAAQSLLGEHHFGSFQGSGCNARNPVKNIHQLDFQENCQILSFSIKASGFLRHMVRNIVGTLVDVGQNKLAPAELETILAAKDRTKAGPTAPPQGLFMAEVEY